MSKRTKIVIKTKEGETLRRLRVMRCLSVRKVGDLLGISHTMVNHLEIGRANISEEYVFKFLKALNYKNEDWKRFLTSNSKASCLEKNELLEECISKLRNLPEEKLKQLHSVLKSF